MSQTTEQAISPALTVRDLWAGYDGRPVLEAVNLQIDRGDMVGIIGPNGSGKSTLIKTVLGLVKPLRGDVSVLGSTGTPERHLVGYTPQTELVDWNFPVTVSDVALMGRYSRRGLFRRTTSEDREAADAALEMVKMLDLRDRLIGELSGGQRRRVLLARAMAHNPKLLLLDEPMAGLDATVQHQLLDLMDELRDNGTTVILSTHDLSCVSQRCDKAACLNHRLIAFGKPSEVLNEQVLGDTFGTHLLMVHLDGQAYAYQHHTHSGSDAPAEPQAHD
ncbi:MAG: metal ABC transporter ATP-binding protein [SAR202 cluster bacterium]|nr:metal ABC transporter ATP-binding protein [SAR202 cluster bacterium]HCP22653.1 manganese ABC transporter ATP-binding protein [Dehalococcoidia bacterium]